MLIDLVQLRTFVTVAEEQHLTRGAERLHMSQSAASAHIRSVEDSLGTQLFVRTNRSLELTRAGQLVLHKAKALLNEAAVFRSVARELDGRIEGRLVVGAGSEPGSRVGEIITAVREQHPLVTVEIIARPSRSTRQSLKSGEIDVAVLLGRASEPGFTHYHLTLIDFVVAGPGSWRERLQDASWEELAAMPWMTPTNSTAHAEMLGQLFAHRGLELNTVIHFDNASLARSILRAGAGVMLARADQIADEVRAGALAIAPHARAQYPLCIAHQSGRRDDPLIRAFLEAAARSWPAMAPVAPTGA
ncbi:MAG TPA: LysR family transcriptional regulator [Ramlibacter sp.]|nr:LysR family transcriptional regulator [Ramlibacter sp.]